MINSLRTHNSRRRGTTAMEYLFMLSLIIVVAMIGIGYLGQSTKANLQNSSNTINNAMGGQ
jgi:uncharacterized protein (UPF0333 family)